VEAHIFDARLIFHFIFSIFTIFDWFSYWLLIVSSGKGFDAVAGGCFLRECWFRQEILMRSSPLIFRGFLSLSDFRFRLIVLMPLMITPFHCRYFLLYFSLSFSFIIIDIISMSWLLSSFLGDVFSSLSPFDQDEGLLLLLLRCFRGRHFLHADDISIFDWWCWLSFR